jgi:predicted DNA-binding transcriptional regulator AlpA
MPVTLNVSQGHPKMTTMDWTTKRNELSALFKAFYELLAYENDLRLKRIEDKLDQVLHERVRPWSAATTTKLAEQRDTDEMMPVLSDNGYIRLSQIRKYYVPVSQATWWRWIKDGRAPQPVKIGGVTMWRSKDMRAFLDTVPENGERTPGGNRR